jgi:predicted N-formylglutamate amidohydrolase
MKPISVKAVFTCEHGGNLIPDPYKPLFENFKSTLTTFKAYDIGAMNLYKDLLEETGDYGNHFQYCRMLVDVDKDIKSPQLFSQPVSKLPTKERNKILKQFYYPWREEVENQIASLSRSNYVLHCSVHTFPQVVNGVVRNVDVAVLFDTEREWEALFAGKFVEFLRQENPKLLVEPNYPIPGGHEGFVHYLKQQKFSKKYIGIQLEVNQSFPLGKSDKWIALKRDIVKCFKIALKEFKTSLL